MDIASKAKEVRDISLSKYRHYEVWPRYYERRYIEFLSLAEKFPKRKFDRVLEIGCGIGYYSAFLSFCAETVVATDLEDEDVLTHSLGLQPTRDFLADLDITNVEVMAASGDSLPFPDNSFDMVFSSHVLEHIPDRKKAIEEINRVLKPGGYNFCVTPAGTDRIYAFVNFYLYLFKRVFHHTIGKRFQKSENTVSAVVEAQSEGQLGSSIKKQLKHFPFPPPHGEYKHYFYELFCWKFSDWRKLITKNGSIELIESSTSQMNPLLPLMSQVWPWLSIKAHEATRKLESTLGKSPLFRWLGFSSIVITRKAT
ncbi:MAG: class I SAM-dependent methyltransferase [Bacteroidota bacterium]